MSFDPMIPQPSGENAAASENGKLAILARHEQVIRKHLEGFYEVGIALTAIKVFALYKEKHYESFDDYCLGEWEFKGQRGRQYIAAAEVMDNLRKIDSVKEEDLPKHESHVRPLAKLTDDDQRTVWKEVVEAAQGGKITADDVKQALNEFLRRRKAASDSRPKSGWHVLLPSNATPPKGLKAQTSGFVDGQTMWEVVSEDAIASIAETIEQVAERSKRGLTRSANASRIADWVWAPIVSGVTDTSSDSVYPEPPQGAIIAPDRLNQPKNTDVPSEGESPRETLVHVCPGLDVFAPEVPDAFIGRLVTVMAEAPEWTFLVLTRYPERLRCFTFSSNVMVGLVASSAVEVEEAEAAFDMVNGGTRWLYVPQAVEPVSLPSATKVRWVVLDAPSGEETPFAFVENLWAEQRVKGYKVHFRKPIRFSHTEWPSVGSGMHSLKAAA